MAVVASPIQYILNGMNALARQAPSTTVDPRAVEVFVEEVARYFEDAGLPRIAGRLIGALMVAEPREQSAADLAHRLHASRASISTMGRLLIAAGIVERWTVPGHRREYLRFRDDAWPTVMMEKTRWISELRRLGERGLQLYAGTDGPARESLSELVDLMEFFEREWPPLMERWVAERAAEKGTAGA
jgi:DNA-binding transcriptional regulator GbsR (MarR family)